MRTIRALALAAFAATLLVASPLGAVTDSFTATVTVASTTTVTAVSLGPIPVDFDIGIGEVTVVSNDPDGFSMAFRNTNAGSALQHTTLSAGDAGEVIDYDLYLTPQFGTLGATAPAGPFSAATAVPTTNLFADNTYDFTPAASATNFTWGVRLVIAAFDHAYSGTFEDTIEFEILDL